MLSVGLRRCVCCSHRVCCLSPFVNIHSNVCAPRMRRPRALRYTKIDAPIFLHTMVHPAIKQLLLAAYWLDRHAGAQPLAQPPAQSPAQPLAQSPAPATSPPANDARIQNTIDGWMPTRVIRMRFEHARRADQPSGGPCPIDQSRETASAVTHRSAPAVTHYHHDRPTPGRRITAPRYRLYKISK